MEPSSAAETIATLLRLTRPIIALASMVFHFSAGLVGGSWVLGAFGGGSLWPLWFLLSPIWLMLAVLATVMGVDGLRGRIVGEPPVTHSPGDRQLLLVVGGGGVLCVAAWVVSGSPVHAALCLTVAVVVGGLWHALPGDAAARA